MTATPQSPLPPRQERGRNPHRPHRLLLAAILCCYLALATLYSATVPLGEGPDESGHMAYVLFLVRQGRLPDQRKGTAGEVPGEGHQPPLAYWLMVPAAEWLPGKTRRVNLTPDPNFVWRGGTSPAAFARGSQEYWPWQGVPLAWHLARGVGVLLGAITVGCAWTLARLLRPDRPLLAVGAAALLAFNPQFLFSSALVSNDPLLAALAALLLLGCVHTARGGNWPRWLPASLALGLTLGLILVTKQSGLLLAPLPLLALWQNPKRQILKRAMPAQHRLQPSLARARHLLVDGVICGLAALALSAWWYARNWWLYGDPLGLSVFQAEFAGDSFAWQSAAAWLDGLGRLHASLWGTFGWMTVPSPLWVYWAIGGVELLVLAGLLRAKLQSPNSRVQTPGLLLPLALLLAFAWTVSFAFTAGLVAWQGRFLFPAITALTVLLAWGLLAWGRWLLWSTVVALACLAALSPAQTIIPSYHWFTLTAQQALAQRGSPTYGRFGDADRLGIELHGWRLDPSPLRAGQQATMQFTWHARSRIGNDWIVFIHLLDGEREVFTADERPFGGAFPTTMWTQDDWLVERRSLMLPPDLPPGRYTLRVGLYNAATGRRAPYFNDDDRENVEGDSLDIAEIEVVP